MSAQGQQRRTVSSWFPPRQQKVISTVGTYFAIAIPALIALAAQALIETYGHRYELVGVEDAALGPDPA
jgi:hypothetical protein